ncbi:MAG: 3-phosphoshikimate 1-carboxyvinyltransferase [Deltaproteobacteria bacterium]|nr:3-phosphoshikimate 1-carboxyvinyltransferase [Deltaproteobacteria bacterium]
MDWRVVPSRGVLTGRARVPGDKSIGHRALLFGALCNGACEIVGLSSGEDNQRTAQALRAMGVRIEEKGAHGVVVHGVGLRGLKAPSSPLDLGNSGTSMRLFAGLMAAQSFPSVLMGDEYLTKRPMRRVTEPLSRMGGRLRGQPGKKAGEEYPPLEILGDPADGLVGITHDSKVASAQVKSAILIAGLYARGVTFVREPGPSRDHTERMLAYLGGPVETPRPGVARVTPDGWNGVLSARRLVVPGDPSSAAFLVAAALAVGTGPGGVVIEATCHNPTRTGFLDALRAMGAHAEPVGLREEAGEPVADWVVPPGQPELRGVELGGDLVVRAIDEIPILAVLAARARGTTVVRNAAELRVKESDRVATTVRMLRAFGVDADELPDGLVVTGSPDRKLDAACVDSAGDHRIAMSAAVAALCAEGESRVIDVANVATSFPSFRALMASLGAEITGVEGEE